jgi:pimeloyl-ACP methyl ester carboxylesterase
LKEFILDGRKFSEFWLNLNRINIHLVAGGEGVPIVLLHGWPGFWKDWEKVMPALADNFSVLAPDLRGFGLSSKPESSDEYTLDHYSKDLESLLDSLSIGKAIIVGYDVGSVVAAYFAAHNTERAEGLVLLNPSYPGIGKRRIEEKYVSESWYQYFHLLDLAERLVGYSRETTKIYLTHFYRYWGYRSEAFNERDIEEYVDIYYYKGGLKGGFNWYKARVKTRYGDWLGGRVLVPTLVLWSDRDPVFPLEWSDRVQEYFPNSELRIISECGHFIPREKPEEVVRYIKKFFYEKLLKKL